MSASQNPETPASALEIFQGFPLAEPKGFFNKRTVLPDTPADDPMDPPGSDTGPSEPVAVEFEVVHKAEDALRLAGIWAVKQLPTFQRRPVLIREKDFRKDQDTRGDCPSCFGSGVTWKNIMLHSLGQKVCSACGGLGKHWPNAFPSENKNNTEPNTPMGNWTAIIRGTGANRNKSQHPSLYTSDDADRLIAGFVEELRKHGQVVNTAVFHAGRTTTDLLTDAESVAPQTPVMPNPAYLLPPQVQVVEEFEDLAAKTGRLQAFINESNAIYSGLPDKEKLRLCRQLHFMESYCGVLQERIADFPETVPEGCVPSVHKLPAEPVGVGGQGVCEPVEAENVHTPAPVKEPPHPENILSCDPAAAAATDRASWRFSFGGPRGVILDENMHVYAKHMTALFLVEGDLTDAWLRLGEQKIDILTDELRAEVRARKQMTEAEKSAVEEAMKARPDHVPAPDWYDMLSHARCMAHNEKVLESEEFANASEEDKELLLRQLASLRESAKALLDRYNLKPEDLPALPEMTPPKDPVATPQRLV